SCYSRRSDGRSSPSCVRRSLAAGRCHFCHRCHYCHQCHPLELPAPAACWSRQTGAAPAGCAAPQPHSHLPRRGLLPRLRRDGAGLAARLSRQRQIGGGDRRRLLLCSAPVGGLLSGLLLHETLPLSCWLGVLVLVVGTLVVSWTPAAYFPSQSRL